MTPTEPPRIPEAAAVGFERGADDHVAARPGYPASAIDLLADELGSVPGADGLDLAAGTGGRERSAFPHDTVVRWCRRTGEGS